MSIYYDEWYLSISHTKCTCNTRISDSSSLMRNLSFSLDVSGLGKLSWIDIPSLDFIRHDESTEFGRLSSESSE